MMSNIAIEVEGIGKRYRVGERARRKRSDLLGVIAEGIRYPLQNLRRVRDLATFGEQGADPPNVFWALKDISFTMREGEVLGVVGRNGAGKSTLLKILSRITEPTLGQARVVGRVGSLLEVGTGFHPELTGRENVYLNGSILGMRRSYIDAHFDEIVEFAGVERFIDTPVKRYSSGMHLRLAFAVAAHLEPEILVIDEILAVGDAEFQRRCLAKMDDVARGGRTVLFVSHNLDAVRALCPRALLIEHGRLTADGPTGEIIRSYLTTTALELPGDWIDLTDVQREGTGAARIRAVKYSGPDAQMGFHPCTEEPLEFQLDVESDAQREVGSIGLSIASLSGTNLISVDSLATATKVPLRRGANQVRLAIRQLHLMPGRYRVSFWIADPLAGSKSRAAFDVLDEAIDIEVVSRLATPYRPRVQPTVVCEAEIEAIPTERADPVEVRGSSPGAIVAT